MKEKGKQRKKCLMGRKRDEWEHRLGNPKIVAKCCQKLPRTELNGT